MTRGSSAAKSARSPSKGTPECFTRSCTGITVPAPTVGAVAEQGPNTQDCFLQVARLTVGAVAEQGPNTQDCFLQVARLAVGAVAEQEHALMLVLAAQELAVHPHHVVERLVDQRAQQLLKAHRRSAADPDRVAVRLAVDVLDRSPVAGRSHPLRVLLLQPEHSVSEPLHSAQRVDLDRARAPAKPSSHKDPPGERDGLLLLADDRDRDLDRQLQPRVRHHHLRRPHVVARRPDVGEDARAP
eukprot:CAMPEP_0119402130 /NCGR_PEP_ID=MMETSP1334-20130426/142723_1 /TAXON_ID=127549 /ORGANISM="Calcidiscus leptoporus, Strain RCC1130" /LENGTH=241 /DNA_ID=CAMNT_0007426057 /DNA_START=360 /DNA_END=1082 /DNA_ORIENTATION=+